MAKLKTTDIYGDLRITGEVKSDKDITEKGQKLEDKYVNMEEMNQIIEEMPEDIIQSATAPEGVEEGRLWLDLDETEIEETLVNQLEVNLNTLFGQVDGRIDSLSKADIALGNVDNVKQMPIAGGSFSGPAKAKSDDNLLNAQLRNVTFSSKAPTSSDGQNGDIWFVIPSGGS